MSLFSFAPDEVVTSYSFWNDERGGDGLVHVARQSESDARTSLRTDSLLQVNLQDQFIIFQLNAASDGPPILECSQVMPSIPGGPDEPDILVNLEMLSFHVGENEGVEPDSRATLRINFGKDESSTDKRFDTVFWSIAAGLNLYDSAKKQRAESKGFRTDIQKAFGNRPIEIPGGLGRLSFEVVKHKEPEWWQRIFSFLKTNTAGNLVSVLGFPAITLQAINVLDELLERLADSKPEVLFKSLPMRLALSKYASDEFTGGNPRVRIGVLNRGFCVLVRGRDFKTVSKAGVLYYPAYGRLVPQSVTQDDLVEGSFDDPLRDVTYAVFRIGMKSTRIDPNFNYSA